MAASDSTPPHHHARVKRAKRLLKFMPRRAVFHNYPLIGRFAALARQRAYLWSFKTAHVRPAFYAGSILSLLPVMGVQLPIALALALVLRANFMVMGGLQSITNPFTAAPIYYATYKLGEKVIDTIGIDTTIVPTERSIQPGGGRRPPELAPAHAEPPSRDPRFSRRLGTTVNALIIGGVLSGALLGFILDMLHRLTRKPLPPPRRASASTDQTGPPK